jgi:hypothetical protein
MKKKLFVLLTMIMVLSLMSIPALAGPPDNSVDGRWCYGNIVYGEPKISGGNAFYDLDDDGAWIGTFEGFSSDDGRVLEHKSGYLLFKSTVSFKSPVKVGNQEYEGDLEMSINGWLPVGAGIEEYEGLWVITRTTGELKGLVGQGTWGGIEENHPDCLAIESDPPIIFFASVPYKGNIHFEK